MPYFFVPCRIERGGFSSERTFSLDREDHTLSGTANVRYLRDANGQPLGDEQPPFGQEIAGFVQCRRIKAEDDRVFVEVPSTDLIALPKGSLVTID
jgi:hypothetical protein